MWLGLDGCARAAGTRARHGAAAKKKKTLSVAAATESVDNVSGSRWCLPECRLRERTVESERPAKETTQVYERALAGTAGGRGR